MRSWDGLEEVVAIADAGTFTGGAVLLGVSTSYISKVVARLEDRLGAQLLNRTTRRVSLTDTGRAFVDQCRRIVQERDELLSQVHGAGEPQGFLRVTCSIAMGERFVAPIVREFAEQNPRISISLDLTNRVVDIVGEGYDIGIRTGDVVDTRLVGRQIAERSIEVCAAPAYPIGDEVARGRLIVRRAMFDAAILFGEDTQGTLGAIDRLIVAAMRGFQRYLPVMGAVGNEKGLRDAFDDAIEGHVGRPCHERLHVGLVEHPADMFPIMGDGILAFRAGAGGSAARPRSGWRPRRRRAPASARRPQRAARNSHRATSPSRRSGWRPHRRDSGDSLPPAIPRPRCRGVRQARAFAPEATSRVTMPR
jgi:DNA-binding transcriptional LysR family regulator